MSVGTNRFGRSKAARRESVQTDECGSVGHSNFRVDKGAGIGVAPGTGGIVMLEHEAQRIHAEMATGADGVGPVRFHLLTQGFQGMAIGRDRSEAGNVGGGGGEPRM